MRCLTDVELQLLTDGEGAEAGRAHATSCERCRARLEERRCEMERLTALVGSEGEAPASLEARVQRAVAPAKRSADAAQRSGDAAQRIGRTAKPIRGATVLRPPAGRRLRPLWATALATAAVIAIVTFVVLPKLGAPTSLSAAQIIDRSLERMTTGSGVEILEYELVTASTFRQRHGMSEGPYRIYQAFDRGNPGHYKFEQYDAAGVLQSASTQDPASGRRSELTRVDGRNYIVNIRSDEPVPSIPELFQAQAESVLKLMQMSAEENLTIVDTPEGRHYVIEMPARQSTAAAGVPLVLHAARVVIDGGDFRVREFAASGVLLKQPFDISFKLLSQVKAATMAAQAWAIAVGRDDVVIEGDGSGRLDDVMNVVLRELGKTRGR